jgi:hypothetical protein
MAAWLLVWIAAHAPPLAVAVDRLRLPGAEGAAGERPAPNARMVVRVAPTRRRAFWPLWVYQLPLVGPLLWRGLLRRGITVCTEPERRRTLDPDPVVHEKDAS